MEKNKKEIFVFADWIGLNGAKLMGKLTAQFGKGKQIFGFEYDENWLKTENFNLIDPDIQFYSGMQFPNNKENFGLFLDSMPDTWGKTLMKRRASQNAKISENKTPTLHDIDFLLGVYDATRMGAIRFKTNLVGDFLDNDSSNPTPPWSSIRELQNASKIFEEDSNNSHVRDWLQILMAPGSSLGGARPKANIVDENKNLWIAKFPSKNDTTDKAAWEFLTYQLALKAKIQMTECKLEKIANPYSTFFTKRFDREKEDRIHFASAMSMIGKTEEILRYETASYLEIVDFIQSKGIDVDKNLEQLWRRIVFNILVSNTDDHLRNHGFILKEKGWELSPAYDINPSIEKVGLSLNIDLNDNALDINLAKSVGKYFRLGEMQMTKIISDVELSVAQWQEFAYKIGISRAEIELMKPAFRI